MIDFNADAAQAAADQKAAYGVAPKGDYFLTCVDAKEKKSKTNRDMIELELVVSTGEYTDRARMWDYFVFIEAGAKGHGMTLHALKCWGFPADGRVQVSGQAFIGRTVKASVIETEYNGKPKNEVERYHLLTEEELNQEAFDGNLPPAQPVEEEPAAPPPPVTRTAAPPAPPAPRAATATVARPAAPPAARKLPWKK